MQSAYETTTYLFSKKNLILDHMIKNLNVSGNSFITVAILNLLF